MCYGEASAGRGGRRPGLVLGGGVARVVGRIRGLAALVVALAGGLRRVRRLRRAVDALVDRGGHGVRALLGELVGVGGAREVVELVLVELLVEPLGDAA